MPDTKHIKDTDADVHHETKNESVNASKHTERNGLNQPLLALLGAGVVIVALWLSFGAGRHYQQHMQHQPAMPPGTPAVPYGSGRRGSSGRTNRLGNVGQVSSVSSTSITINNSRTSASQTFSIVSGTQIINQGAIGSISDVKTGQTVAVETLSSNTQQASRITINPAQAQPL